LKHLRDPSLRYRQSRRGSEHPMYGKTHRIEVRKKLSKVMKGRKMPEFVKRNISESIRSHQTSHAQLIKEQMKILQEQGYRVIPIHGYIKPDLIAIKGKDVKIFGVEVEVRRAPKYDKYENFQFYDDIIWIVKEKWKLERRTK